MVFVAEAMVVLALALGGCSVREVADSGGLIEDDPGEQEDAVVRERRISSGGYHSCMLSEQGELSCWGRSGQLQGVPGGVFDEVSAGYWHTCARAASRVECWGNLEGENYGQNSPPSGVDWVDIDAGYSHNCGLSASGSIECWGLNNIGQLDVPGSIDGPIQDLSAGYIHSCAIDATGQVLCWGDYGADEEEETSGPFVQVSAGYIYTCGLRVDGSVTCWGCESTDHDRGQCDVPDRQFVQVSAGLHQVCALGVDGEVTCWGRGGFDEADAPSGTYLEVSAGRYHSCAVAGSESMTCWGIDDGSAGDFGQVTGAP